LSSRQRARQNREQHDDEQVPREQEPARPRNPEERVIVEEPDLSQHQRDRRQRGRDDPGDTSDQHHERDEPHQVLGREDLRERQEAGDRSGEGDRQLGPGLASTGIEHPDGGDRGRLEDECRRSDCVRQRAAQVPPGDAGRAHDVGVVEPEPVEQEQQRGAEALDLKPARRLGAKAGGDPL